MKRPLHWALVFAACLLATACASGPILPEPGSHEASVVSRGCEHLSRHQYEVCYAYLVNDSLLARVPWYEVGRKPELRQAALTRLNPTILCVLGHCLHKWVVVRIR